MGFYLEVDVTIGKVRRLVQKYNAETIECPDTVKKLPIGKALVCVVENSMFDAALYVPDDKELVRTFKTVGDGRFRTYLVMDEEIVKKLSHYTEV